MLRQKKILEHIVCYFQAKWLHFLDYNLQELLICHLLIKVPNVLAFVNLIFFKFSASTATNRQFFVTYLLLWILGKTYERVRAKTSLVGVFLRLANYLHVVVDA